MELASTQSGGGRRVVLVHGLTQTAASWATIATDLSVDQQVVSVDCAGHGGSPPARGDLWTNGSLLVDAGGCATYVGYSMGGRLCLHAALAEPARVERLVVLSATGGIDDPEQRAARRADDDELADEIERDGVADFLDRWLARPMFAGVPDDRSQRLSNSAAGLASSLRTCGVGLQEPLWHRLGELTMPVLVLAGQRDHKFVGEGTRLARAIGTNAEFATVPGAGHAAHLERPHEFLRLLRRWMAQHPVSP